MKKIILIILFLIVPIFSSYADKCYVFIEKSGNFNPSIMESLSVSLISKYIEKVKAIPKFGIKEQDCSYDVSLMESMNGFQYTIVSKNINSMGTSKKPGLDGLTQSLLRALYRSKDGDTLKRRICNDYAELMAQDCKPIEAVVMLYNERGEIIPNGSTVREGNSFFVMLKPMTDSYAAVFNKDSKGNFFRIFPNPQISSQTNPLRAHKQYFFPPQNSDLIFQFDDNSGEESFYFVISSTPMNDIDSVYNSIESGARNLTPVLEQRIRKRGISLGKKKYSTGGSIGNLPSSGDLLMGKGAIVKTVKLRHLAY